jgi:hypothetical protein
MRSDLVFEAISQVPNRYQLCQLVSKATRKLHTPNTRVPETTNFVLRRYYASALPTGRAVQGSLTLLKPII